MINILEQQISTYKAEIEKIVFANQQDLEAFRIAYLGSKGSLKSLMAVMKDVPPADKKIAGMLLNEFKNWVENFYEESKNKLAETPDLSAPETERIDWTLPGSFFPIGSRHPLSIIKNEIIEIFQKMGFGVVEGPEIEDDWHNFGAMNLPENHPARDMQDTFYIHQKPDWLLRTHTSSVQARIMETEKPPIRIICPGRVYRNETISARAHCFFHQVEGLYINENVSFAQLKQTLYLFVQEMFGVGVQIRFRPSYFPFTEPSAEMDISCLICGGKGCTVCKHTGWVEILGSGMVHPQVLENFNIDPKVYTGFAFGMGIERICQLKFRINDLRLYSQNDIRFLQQFSTAL